MFNDLRSLWSWYRHNERRWQEAHADLDDSAGPYLPLWFALGFLVLGLATLYVGGIAIGWWG